MSCGSENHDLMGMALSRENNTMLAGLHLTGGGGGGRGTGGLLPPF